MNPLAIRKRLGKTEWLPPDPFGLDGWIFRRRDRLQMIIVTTDEFDGVPWIHASISQPTSMPTYDDLKALHTNVFGDGYAYQLFVPKTEHVNLHNYALHLWGRADGRDALPDFGKYGTI